jgi:DNA-binding protein HU-beta
LTKGEFLAVLARDRRIGTKRRAADAVEAVLDSVAEVLASGEEVSFSGFGKFHVAERGARRGVNPRTGEPITIPSGRVPRFTAGSSLKAKVKSRA